MMRWWTTLVLGMVAIPGVAAAETPARSTEAIADAVRKAIPVLERGARGSAEQRECFTCHNQAVPVFALAAARTAGYDVDGDNLQQQLEHTFEHLKRGRDNYLEAKGQGGQALTAGYALLTLEAGGWPADDVTSAVTHYLLQRQKSLGHWKQSSNRPPSSGSDFAVTYVSLRGIQRFRPDEQAEEAATRQQRISEWLQQSAAKDNEDRVFRLRCFSLCGDEQSSQAAVEELLQQQRDDGGWAQNDELESDAYATGTALVALLQDGGCTPDHPAMQRGIEYLLSSQLEDGTWRVTTRANGFQEYFESGFPHDEDQFISMAASGWATLALILADQSEVESVTDAKEN